MVRAAAPAILDRGDPDPLSLILAGTLRVGVLRRRHATFLMLLIAVFENLFSGRNESGIQKHEARSCPPAYRLDVCLDAEDL